MNDKVSFRKTKIVATLGPGTSDLEQVHALCRAGVNVFRVNSSHGTPQERSDLMDIVQSVRCESDVYVGLLLDLQGPRIRVGVLEHPIELKVGADVVFAPDTEAVEGEIPTTYHSLAQDVEIGSRILMDDGLLVTEVLSVSGLRVSARVVYGGKLKSNKGMNLPGVKVSAPAVTEKDEEDIALALDHHADYVGVSFVRRAEDIEAVRAKIPERLKIVAKIEKAEALGDLERIVQATDAVMVARGDLGVELPFEEVPLAQKRVIEMANRYGKAVITATQMLESMVENPRPTRAEASDVANAILDGTDAVMLSAETAVGKYPVEAVNAMVRIINEMEGASEGDGDRRRRRWDYQRHGEGGVDEAIAVATCAAAEMIDVPLILCFTKSGFTAKKISAHRPNTPIVALSTLARTCRQLSLVWGVRPEFATYAPNYDAMLVAAREVLDRRGYVSPGDHIVVTAGVPFDVAGTTNLLKVEEI